jgi:hypothetical protein
MPTQIEFVHKWGVSKGIISRYHTRGMPLSSYDAAEEWLAHNVPFGKLHCAAEEARLGPTRLEPEPLIPARSEEDRELMRLENEREEALRKAWLRFKKKPVFTENEPGYSEVGLLACWAIVGLTANGVSEETAFDLASFAAIVTGAPNGCGWKPYPRKANPKHEKVPANG